MMSPQRLALRNLLLARTRDVLAILLICASLCVLNLFAGHITSVRARLEHQTVIAGRVGHLAIIRRGARFDATEAQRIRRIVENQPGVLLAMPQMRVAGIAVNGTRSALFQGEGIVPHKGLALPGQLRGGNGVAVSSAQAAALGLREGSPLILTAVALDLQRATIRFYIDEFKKIEQQFPEKLSDFDFFINKEN